MLDGYYNLKLLNFGVAQGSDLDQALDVTEDLKSIGDILFELITKISPPREANADNFWDNVSTDNLSTEFIDIIEIML